MSQLPDEHEIARIRSEKKIAEADIEYELLKLDEEMAERIRELCLEFVRKAAYLGIRQRFTSTRSSGWGWFKTSENFQEGGWEITLFDFWESCFRDFVVNPDGVLAWDERDSNMEYLGRCASGRGAFISISEARRLSSSADPYIVNRFRTKMEESIEKLKISLTERLLRT